MLYLETHNNTKINISIHTLLIQHNSLYIPQTCLTDKWLITDITSNKAQVADNIVKLNIQHLQLYNLRHSHQTNQYSPVALESIYKSHSHCMTNSHACMSVECTGSYAKSVMCVCMLMLLFWCYYVFPSITSIVIQIFDPGFQYLQL